MSPPPPPAARLRPASTVRSGSRLMLVLAVIGSVVGPGLVPAAADPPPEAEWANGIGGTKHDEGNAVTVDGAGNVYTTGSFARTVDFDPGPGVFNLTSAGSSDVFVSKSDGDGNLVWAVALGGPALDEGLGVAVDRFGNVHVAGRFRETADFDPGPGLFELTAAGDDDAFVWKLDGDGNLVWAAAMGGAGSGRGFESGQGVAVDGFGNVYTTGGFKTTADFDPGPGVFELTPENKSQDVFVSKLDGDGNFLWAVALGGPDFDEGHGVAVDGTGNVYTTGYFRGTADFDPGLAEFDLTAAGLDDVNDAFVSKLDGDGSFVWAVRLGDTSEDAGSAIAVDEFGDVVATGLFNGTVDFDPGPGTLDVTSAGLSDAFVWKLDGAGELVWAATMGGSDTDEGHGVAVDGFGSVYSTGFFRETADFDPGPGTFDVPSSGSRDVFLSKLTGTGTFVWAAAMGGAGTDVGRGAAVDSSGSLHATGFFNGTADFDPGPGTLELTSAGDRDVFVVKLPPDTTCNGLVATHLGTSGDDALVGGPGDDVIVGLGGNDTIDGGGGDDTICGGDGDDLIDAGTGDDLINGGAGNDSIDGAAGVDTLTYADAPSGVSVDLGAGTATGGGGTDSMLRIRHLIGSSHDDALSGNANDNRIEGRGGNDKIKGKKGDDTILGGDGDDVILGRAGDDTVDGGTGTDTASFFVALGAITVDLGVGTATGDGADTLIGIENARGSRHDDTITGDAGPNDLIGYKGNDTLHGAGGDDTLRGKQHDDTMFGDGGDDRLLGAAGTDTADGGPGTDLCRAETTVGCE